MMVARIMSCVGAFLALGAGAGALALEVEALEWARAEPVSKAYSIETPCTADEVALASVRPMPIGTARLNPTTQVVCKKGGLLFASGTSAGLEGDLAEGQSVFDVVIESVQATGGTLPEGAFDLIDGRRAIQNREGRDGIVAQTTIIEISEREVLMMLAGGPFDGNGAEMDVDALIDRHSASLEIAQ